MTHTTSQTINVALKLIENESAGDLSFIAQGYKHKVFYRGHCIGLIRRSKLLGFCDGWITCRDRLREEPLVYRGMDVQTGVHYVLRQLSDKQIMQASDPEQKNYRGFAALHETCDANMLLPFCEDFNVNEEEMMRFYNVLMSEVTKVLCNIWDSRKAGFNKISGLSS